MCPRKNYPVGPALQGWALARIKRTGLDLFLDLANQALGGAPDKGSVSTV